MTDRYDCEFDREPPEPGCDPAEVDRFTMCLDTHVIVQLWRVWEYRQLDAPSPEHKKLLRELKTVRDRLVHNIRPREQDREATWRLIRELVELERGSLGAPAARRARRRTPAAAINEILTRADEPAES